MGELGNFFTVCVIFVNIVRFAGTLTAQTRQDSETTHTGRTPHPPSFAPALATNRHRASSSLVCTTRGVHFVDVWPHTGPFASSPAPHEPKTLRFCLISSLSTRRRRGMGGCIASVWWVYSWCGCMGCGLALGAWVCFWRGMLDWCCGIWKLVWGWACGNRWDVVYPNNQP